MDAGDVAGQRGWLKVHAMIDVETNQVPVLEVTDESVQDDRMFVPLLDLTRQVGKTSYTTTDAHHGTTHLSGTHPHREHRDYEAESKGRGRQAAHAGTGA